MAFKNVIVSRTEFSVYESIFYIRVIIVLKKTFLLLEIKYLWCPAHNMQTKIHISRSLELRIRHYELRISFLVLVNRGHKLKVRSHDLINCSFVLENHGHIELICSLILILKGINLYNLAMI